MASGAVLVCKDAYRPPHDAEDLFIRDAVFIRGMVRKSLGPGASGTDVEDVVADIIEKLVARDVISMYDPEHYSHATWRTFLGNQVALYCRWKREQVGKRHLREVHAPAGDDGTWLEHVTGQAWDDYPSLSDGEVIQRLRAYLAVPRGGWDGPVSLLELFEVMVRRATAGEATTRSVLQAEFGLTPAAARTGLSRLRGTLRECLAPRKVEVAGVTLTLKEAAAAAAALLQARGNRVAPALAAIGSPLAALDTRQYIKLGKAELRAYPECQVSRGSRHANHSSQTKVALIHLLSRLAGTAAVAPPAVAPSLSAVPPEPEEVSAEEQLEARLWRFEGMTPAAMDEILGLARSAYAEG